MSLLVWLNAVCGRVRAVVGAEDLALRMCHGELRRAALFVKHTHLIGIKLPVVTLRIAVSVCESKVRHIFRSAVSFWDDMIDRNAHRQSSVHALVDHRKMAYPAQTAIAVKKFPLHFARTFAPAQLMEAAPHGLIISFTALWNLGSFGLYANGGLPKKGLA